MKKKGQLKPVAAIATVLVVTGIVLGFGAYINSQIVDEAFTGTTKNESYTFTNATYTWLGSEARSITSVANQTHVVPVSGSGGAGTAYYTSRNIGQKTQVILYTNSTIVAGTYNVTYRALDDGGVQALNNATQGMNTLASWLPIIAVVLGAAVVIGLLYMAFRP